MFRLLRWSVYCICARPTVLMVIIIGGSSRRWWWWWTAQTKQNTAEKQRARQLVAGTAGGGGVTPSASLNGHDFHVYQVQYAFLPQALNPLSTTLWSDTSLDS